MYQERLQVDNLVLSQFDSTVTDFAAARLRTGRFGYRFVKRVFDIVFSLAVLITLFPLMLLVCVAIRLDSPGPAIFRQTRLSKDGKPFVMFKFRSMCNDAEHELSGLKELNEKDGPVFKIKNDPRVTRVGRFIRATSIDELPQFLNVLLGDISIVGPRPPLPNEAEQYSEWERQRLLVKSGITCFWQVEQSRDNLSFREWVALDLRYIRECSVLTDLKLILQTVLVVLTAQGS